MRVTTSNDLANIARGRRRDLGLSQTLVARRARVSRKWVSDFENGKASVDLATTLRLLEVLELTLDVGTHITRGVSDHAGATDHVVGHVARGATDVAAGHDAVNRHTSIDRVTPVDLDAILDTYKSAR